MKLFGSTTSPFVRTARMAAIELGLEERVEFVPTVVKPTQPNQAYGADVNPLRRIPALELDDGVVIVDSRVIVDCLNAIADGKLLPSQCPDRINCHNRYSIVAGATECLVSAMYENKIRPEANRWFRWFDDHIDKAHKALNWVEQHAAEFETSVDLSTLGLVSMIGYGQFRFPDIDWLDNLPKTKAIVASLSDRESVRTTVPKE